MAKRKFQGVPYPIVKTAKGLLPTQNGTRQIRSDLLILLMTNPGERVMLPDFGTPLRRLVFEPADDTLTDTARQMIISSIRTWEPRITIENLEVTLTADDDDLNPLDTKDNNERILFIKIEFFDPEEIDVVDELILHIPLIGGTAGG